MRFYKFIGRKEYNAWESNIKCNHRQIKNLIGKYSSYVDKKRFSYLDKFSDIYKFKDVSLKQMKMSKKFKHLVFLPRTLSLTWNSPEKILNDFEFFHRENKHFLWKYK